MSMTRKIPPMIAWSLAVACSLGAIRWSHADVADPVVPEADIEADGQQNAWAQAIQAAITIQAREREAGELETPDSRPEPLRGVEDPARRQVIYREAIEALGTPDLDPSLSRDEIMEQRHLDREVLKYGGPEVLDLLIEAMDHEDVKIRGAAISLLRYHGRQALEPLHAAMLTDPDRDVRSAAVSSLSRIAAAESVPFLVKALKDDSDGVRGSAARLLGDFGDASAMEPLAQVLEADVNLNWCYVIEAMNKIDHEEARRLVTQIANDLDIQDPDNKGVSQRLIRRVGSNSYPQPFQAISVELEPVRQLSLYAKTIAGESYGEEQIQELIKYIDSEPLTGMSFNCLVSLLHLQARQAVPEIIGLIEEGLAENGVVPSGYCTTLAKFGGEDAWNTLVQAYDSMSGNKDRRLQRKQIVVMALGQAGRAAVPILMLMLDDPELYREARDMPTGFERHRAMTWPASHDALRALARALQCSQWVNLAGGGRQVTDFEAEVQAMKQWWAENGEAFIAGQPTEDPPTVAIYMFMS